MPADALYIGATTDAQTIYTQSGILKFDTFASGFAFGAGLIVHWSKINGGAGWNLANGDSLLVQTRCAPIKFSSFTTSAKSGGNTGTGSINSTTCLGLPNSPGIEGTVAGTYVVTLTSATSFSVADPSGAIVGYGDVGTQYIGGGVSFLMTAGGTAFVAGDGFTIVVAAATGSTIVGNTGTSGNGFSLAVSSAGAVTATIKVGSASAVGVVVTPVAWQSPTAFTILPEVFYNFTLYIDGQTKKLMCYVNGEFNTNNASYQIAADTSGSYSTINSPLYNLGLGFSASNAITTTTSHYCVYQTFNMIVIPGSSGRVIKNIRQLDTLFNDTPYRSFTEQELTGYVDAINPGQSSRQISVVCGPYGQSNEKGAAATIYATTAGTSTSGGNIVAQCKSPAVWGQEYVGINGTTQQVGIFAYVAEQIAFNYGADVDYANHAVGGTGSCNQWCGFVKTYAVSTSYAAGDWIFPTGAGYKYQCTVAGTSGASAPTWSSHVTVGATFTDNTVTWKTYAADAYDSVGHIYQWGATFTANSSGTTNITISNVTGTVALGHVIQGTSTTIVSQTSGTTGGAGVYVTSANTTYTNATVITAESGYDPLGYVANMRTDVNTKLSLGREVWCFTAGHQADMSSGSTYAQILQSMKNLTLDLMSQSQVVSGVTNTVKYVFLGVTPQYYGSTFATAGAYGSGTYGAWSAGGWLQNLNSDLTTWMNGIWPGVAKAGGDCSLVGVSPTLIQEAFVGTTSTGDLMIHHNILGISLDAQVWATAVLGN